MTSYTAKYDPATGVFLNVQRNDGAIISPDPLNRDWQAFLAWNQANGNPINPAGTITPAAGIRSTLNLMYGGDGKAFLSGLTALQKTNIWTDFTSNSRWKTDVGNNTNMLLMLGGMALDGIISATTLNAKYFAVALYVQDNPSYLVTPIFDATINVPGLTH